MSSAAGPERQVFAAMHFFSVKLGPFLLMKLTVLSQNLKKIKSMFYFPDCSYKMLL